MRSALSTTCGRAAVAGPARLSPRRSVIAAAAVSTLALVSGSQPAAAGAPPLSSAPAWEIVLTADAGLDIASSERPRPRPLVRHAPGENVGDFVPALSPDGLRVAYMHRGRGGRRDGLYVLDVTGGAFRRLARGDDIDDIAWSPDGTEIAFSRGWSYKHSGIYVVRSRGGPARKVFPAGGFVGWSPDGTKLVCNCRTGLAVWVFDSDGGHPRRLTGAIGALARASWSPDGRLIAFGRRCVGGRDTRCDVAVMDADGKGKRTVLRSRPGGHMAFTGVDPFAFWTSPDTLLVPTGGVPPHIGIYSVDVHSGVQRHISQRVGSLYESPSLTAFASIFQETLVLLGPTGRVLGRERVPGIDVLFNRTVYVGPVGR